MWQAAFASARPSKEYNISTVKKYGDRYKLTHHRAAVKIPGYEQPPTEPPDQSGPGPPARTAEERFSSSLSRTRSAVFELAACNPWEWFGTWTLADDKGFSRYDLTPWYKDFSQWLRNQRRLTKTAVKYLIVPEGHKDGAYHLHALAYGLPVERLRRFTTEDFLPYRILDKLKSGEEVYTWPAYQEKYGWCTLEPIKDRDRCASYIAKYVTKAMTAARSDGRQPQKGKGPSVSFAAGAKMYYASHGLQRAQTLWRGQVYYPPEYQWDYRNDYVAIKWITKEQAKEVMKG